MQASYSHVLITGDFNYKEIDWLTIESTVDIDNDASIFLENIRDLYLTHLKIINLVSWVFHTPDGGENENKIIILLEIQEISIAEAFI